MSGPDELTRTRKYGAEKPPEFFRDVEKRQAEREAAEKQPANPAKGKP